MPRAAHRFRTLIRRRNLALKRAAELEAWYQSTLVGRTAPRCASPDEKPLSEDWSLRRMLEEAYCDMEDQHQRNEKTLPLEARLKLLMADPDNESNYRQALNHLAPHIVESQALNKPLLDMSRREKFREEWATLERLTAIGEHAQHITRLSRVRGHILDHIKSLRKKQKQVFEWLAQTPDIDEYMKPLRYGDGKAIEAALEPLNSAVQGLRAMNQRRIKDLLNMRRMIPDADCGARESLAKKRGANAASPPTNLGRHVAEKALRNFDVPALVRSSLLIVWGFQRAD